MRVTKAMLEEANRDLQSQLTYYHQKVADQDRLISQQKTLLDQQNQLLNNMDDLMGHVSKAIDAAAHIGHSVLVPLSRNVTVEKAQEIAREERRKLSAT